MKTHKPSPKPKENTVRITIDIPESTYIEMKTKVVKERTTIKRFFLELLSKDLENKVT